MSRSKTADRERHQRDTLSKMIAEMQTAIDAQTHFIDVATISKLVLVTRRDELIATYNRSLAKLNKRLP